MFNLLFKIFFMIFEDVVEMWVEVNFRFYFKLGLWLKFKMVFYEWGNIFKIFL